MSYASPVRLAIANALCLLRCWKIVSCLLFTRFSIFWIVHFDMFAKHNLLSRLDDLESEILVDFRTEFKIKSWHVWYGITHFLSIFICFCGFRLSYGAYGSFFMMNVPVILQSPVDSLLSFSSGVFTSRLSMNNLVAACDCWLKWAVACCAQFIR